MKVNYFGIVTLCAEFIGGGIVPKYRIDVVRLFRIGTLYDWIILGCECIFVISVFYYIISLFATFKKEGRKEFFENSWNIVDIFTVMLSLLQIGLYALRVNILNTGNQF